MAADSAKLLMAGLLHVVTVKKSVHLVKPYETYVGDSGEVCRLQLLLMC